MCTRRAVRLSRNICAVTCSEVDYSKYVIPPARTIFKEQPFNQTINQVKVLDVDCSALLAGHIYFCKFSD